MKNLLKKTFLLLALVGGAMNSWAIDIPQDLGSYINWSNATTTNGKNENTGDADGGNLGSTGSSTVSSFTIVNSTQQDYILSFRSSSKDCEATWSITVTNSASENVLVRTFAVTNTGAWTNYYVVHSFLLSSLPADTYTLTFRCTGVTSGSYAGNLKYLAFCKTSDYQTLPLESSSKYLDLGKGTATTTGSPRYVEAENTIGWIPSYGDGEETYPSNAFLDSYFVNNTTSGKYTLKFFLSYANNEGNKAKVKVTITDVKTGNNEIDGVEYDVTYSGDDKSVVLANPISAGIKKIRFDFACKSGSCNFKNVTFQLNSVSATVTAAGWCSFASSYPLDLSTLTATNDVTAYYASAAEGSTVTLTPTGDVSVPAGEGLMIKGTAGETFTINVAASGTAIEDNLLKGQTTTGNVAASGTDGKYHYVFGYKTSDATEYGFYNLAADTEVPAGKAYLETTTELLAGLSARAISIVLADDILTGIEKVEYGEVKSSLPVKRIVNGKLVIEKKGMMFNANGVRIY